MTETAAAELVRIRRPALPSSGRLRALVGGAVLACALGLAGEAAAAPVTVGLGVAADIPAVPIASALTIDRGDPLGVALTVPVLVGGLRFEPQLAWTDQGGAYGVPPAGRQHCPGLVLCTFEDHESARTAVGLAIGPAWSIGERGRLWAGPWGGLTFRWVSNAVRRDPALGVTVGGEFFLADRFSLGLDLRATYTSVDSGGTHVRSSRHNWGGTTYVSEFDRGWTADVDGVAAFRLYLN